MDSKECAYEHDHTRHMRVFYGRWVASILIVSFSLFFIKPVLIQLMLVRVSSYFASYSFENVVRMSKKIIFMDKDNAEAWYALGNAYRDQNRITESVAAYEKVFSLDPEDAQVCFNLGELYFEKGEFAKAAQYFDHIRIMAQSSDKSTKIKADNYLFQSLAMLQKCYESLGDLKKADQIQQELKYYDTSKY